MSCWRIASRYFFWPTVLAVTPGFLSCVSTRSFIRSLSVETPSCLTMSSACMNSRLRTGEPALSEFSSERKRFFARSRPSAGPSSLIQPSREVALTPSWLSSACRLRGSWLKSCCAARAFSKWRVSVGIRRWQWARRPVSVLEGVTQLGGHFTQGLRDHAGPGDDGHEVGVPLPAGDDVDVQMLGDAGAGGLAEVDANVESIGFDEFRQSV